MSRRDLAGRPPERRREPEPDPGLTVHDLVEEVVRRGWPEIRELSVGADKVPSVPDAAALPITA